MYALYVYYTERKHSHKPSYGSQLYMYKRFFIPGAAFIHLGVFIYLLVTISQAMRIFRLPDVNYSGHIFLHYLNVLNQIHTQMLNEFFLKIFQVILITKTPLEE